VDSRLIETPLGNLFALAGRDGLQRLEFAEEERFSIGNSSILDQIEDEIGDYFLGTLKVFKTPLDLRGSSFQKKVWEALLQIPFGQTASYKAVAEAIKNGGAFRAVGHANGLNPLVIIIPCHRVIAANGTLGGYSAGLDRKEWLLKHERSACSKNVSTFRREKAALRGSPLQ
jgi:methylated-DNA-[protein]-cysteine S-methyltransferase